MPFLRNMHSSRAHNRCESGGVIKMRKRHKKGGELVLGPLRALYCLCSHLSRSQGCSLREVIMLAISELANE